MVAINSVESSLRATNDGTTIEPRNFPPIYGEHEQGSRKIVKQLLAQRLPRSELG